MYQALSEVSMNKIALWINICADDWTAERSIIASNDMCYKQKSPSGAIHNFTATKNRIGTKNSRFNLLYRNGHLQVFFSKLKFCFTGMLIRVVTMVISRISENEYKYWTPSSSNKYWDWYRKTGCYWNYHWITVLLVVPQSTWT